MRLNVREGGLQITMGTKVGDRVVTNYGLSSDFAE